MALSRPCSDYPVHVPEIYSLFLDTIQVLATDWMPKINRNLSLHLPSSVIYLSLAIYYNCAAAPSSRNLQLQTPSPCTLLLPCRKAAIGPFPESRTLCRALRARIQKQREHELNTLPCSTCWRIGRDVSHQCTAVLARGTVRTAVSLAC